jgi:hypothetical protein
MRSTARSVSSGRRSTLNSRCQTSRKTPLRATPLKIAHAPGDRNVGDRRGRQQVIDPSFVHFPFVKTPRELLSRMQYLPGRLLNELGLLRAIVSVRGHH